MTALPPAVSPASLLLVDSRVQVPQDWLDAMATETAVFLISAEQNALGQIAAIVEAQPGAKSVHVVSHGSPGSLMLGSSRIDAAALQQNAALLEQIGALLGPDAELLLYGCDVAAGDIGQGFIDLLATLTGASVAVSDDRTGETINGGDWDLEKISGAIAADVLRIQGLQGTLYFGEDIGLSADVDIPALTDGDDYVYTTAANTLNADDVIDGKVGYDVLEISGTHHVAFNATTVTNFEELFLHSDSAISITTHDATVLRTSGSSSSQSTWTLRWTSMAPQKPMATSTSGAAPPQTRCRAVPATTRFPLELVTMPSSAAQATT